MTFSWLRHVALALVVLLGLADSAQAQRAILIVRHGEKVDDSQDPDLTDAGRARAGSLARVLRDIRATTIYSSDFQRTRKTAQPLADSLGLSVSIIARDPASVVRRLRTHRVRDTVVLVAHSDTIPAILRGLGYRETITIADADYDNLFVVMPRAGAPPTVLRLHY